MILSRTHNGGHDCDYEKLSRTPVDLFCMKDPVIVNTDYENKITLFNFLSRWDIRDICSHARVMYLEEMNYY